MKVLGGAKGVEHRDKVLIDDQTFDRYVEAFFPAFYATFYILCAKFLPSVEMLNLR